jgi:hypothetical protein
VTLVQTLMTEDLVILVSDRRYAWPDGSVADDNFTKVVLWRDGFVAAFTGIARINRTGTKSTSEWIAETLADCRKFDHGAATLKQRASERVAALPQWPDSRLAIVLAGFDFRRYPRFAMVSNFLPGEPYPTDPTEFHSYALNRTVGPGVKSTFNTAGANLESWQEVVLSRTVPRTLRQRDGITRAARIMVGLQRKVADAEPTVGRDSMCVVVPRERKGMRGVFGWLGARTLHKRGVNFCYFEDGDYAFTQLGPHVATGAGTAIGDFYGAAEPDNLIMQELGVKFLKHGPPPLTGQMSRTDLEFQSWRTSLRGIPPPPTKTLLTVRMDSASPSSAVLLPQEGVGGVGRPGAASVALRLAVDAVPATLPLDLGLYAQLGQLPVHQPQPQSLFGHVVLLGACGLRPGDSSDLHHGAADDADRRRPGELVTVRVDDHLFGEDRYDLGSSV